MLTEGRVLIKYLTLLGFPSPHRISFVLKFETSRDLVTPVSTLLTWLLIVAACVGAVALRKKMPVVALALLWFFLHHCLESSFIPLEIAFMRRNYLPSVFLFLPLAVWIVNQVPSKPSRTSIAVASSIFLLLMVGWYSRATIWGSPVSFWSDGMAKAPGSLRPYINLGVIRDRQGQHSEAMEIFDRGAINGFDEPASAWASLYCCKGIAATNLGRYEEASAAMDLSMSFMELRDCLLHKANLLLFQSRPKDALIVLDRLGEIAPTHPRLHLLRGKAFLGLGRYDHARDAFRRELSLFPANQRAAELLLELTETD
jgi:tetratricopeptide (TPR) repeat protein